jgi:hypothetical protein
VNQPHLSGFLGELAEAKGIVCKELMVGSKTVPNVFFVDVKGRSNVLLGHDWIHANGCVLSMLHQCVIQWVGEQVEIIRAGDDVCIAMAESQGDIQEGCRKCLTSCDLTDYDYVSIGKEGCISISVKPTVGASQLVDDVV